MKGQEHIIMKNGRPATSGTCSACGTKMFKIGGERGGGKAKAKTKTKTKAAKKGGNKIYRYRPGHDPNGQS